MIGLTGVWGTEVRPPLLGVGPCLGHCQAGALQIVVDHSRGKRLYPVHPGRTYLALQPEIKALRKLLMAAQQRWRRVNAPHLVALVKAAVAFPYGEAEMLQRDLESEELSILTHETLAADGVPTHII